MRLLVTGGTGVLGRALRPLAESDGHEIQAPGKAELDLFDRAAVAEAARGIDAVLHLAPRIQPLDQFDNPAAWVENDRLRADASRILVDAALASDVMVYVQPTAAFVYPANGPTSEDTPVGDVDGEVGLTWWIEKLDRVVVRPTSCAGAASEDRPTGRSVGRRR
jgi:nucleoside-diphosphate-sugar epimerase